MHTLFSILNFLILSTCLQAENKSEYKKADIARVSKAKKVVKTDTIGLYVKGFVCQSCGIGMKKKAANLKFLDKSRFSKGIGVDVPNQLLFFAVTKGSQADFTAINKAVENAGYDPITYYYLKNGKFTSKAASSATSK